MVNSSKVPFGTKIRFAVRENIFTKW